MLVFLVQVVLVVVLGYAIWEATGLGGNPEVVGWLTGPVPLAEVSWLLLLLRTERVRTTRGPRGSGPSPVGRGQVVRGTVRAAWTARPSTCRPSG